MRGTSDMELLCDMIDVFLCMIMIFLTLGLFWSQEAVNLID